MVSISRRKTRFTKKNFKNKKNVIIQKNPNKLSFFWKKLDEKTWRLSLWANLSLSKPNWAKLSFLDLQNFYNRCNDLHKNLIKIYVNFTLKKTRRKTRRKRDEKRDVSATFSSRFFIAFFGIAENVAFFWCQV